MKSTRTPRGTLAILLSTAIIAVACRVFVLDAARISGRSMLPALEPEQLVLVFKAAYGLHAPWRGASGGASGGYILRWASPRAGDIVAATSPVTGLPVVKRVGPGQLSGNRVFLSGDNPAESTDSRSYGPVPVESVIGRVILLRPWPFP